MQIHPGVRVLEATGSSCPNTGALAYSSSAQTIRVDVKPSHSTNSFKPTEALGAGVDPYHSRLLTRFYRAGAEANPVH
jgi:hypothetical protein